MNCLLFADVLFIIFTVTVTTRRRVGAHRPVTLRAFSVLISFVVRSLQMEVGDDAPLVKEGVQGEPVLPEEVIRTKYFTMPRMTVEQAIDNLEMVDHDFYAFQEADSGDCV